MRRANRGLIAISPLQGGTPSSASAVFLLRAYPTTSRQPLSGRGVKGESASNRCRFSQSIRTFACPHPNPLPEGEGDFGDRLLTGRDAVLRLRSFSPWTAGEGRGPWRPPRLPFRAWLVKRGNVWDRRGTASRPGCPIPARQEDTAGQS